MAREYTIDATNQTILGATTLIGIRPGTTAAIQIVRMWVSFNGTPTSAQQRVAWGRQAAALATVVAATPGKVTEGDPVSVITGATNLAAGTCGINASAEGAGVKTQLGSDAFNVLNGWLWVPTPLEVITLAPSSASSFYLWFPSAPAVLTGWTAGVTFREIG
jgi:hypothetical protein